MSQTEPSFLQLLLLATFLVLFIGSVYFSVKAVRFRKEKHIRMASALIFVVSLVIGIYSTLVVLIMGYYHPDTTQLANVMVIVLAMISAMYFGASLFIGRFPGFGKKR